MTKSALLAVLFLLGCTPGVEMRDPQTGHSVTCRGGHGSASQVRCIEDYRSKGYSDVAPTGQTRP